MYKTCEEDTMAANPRHLETVRACKLSPLVGPQPAFASVAINPKTELLFGRANWVDLQPGLVRTEYLGNDGVQEVRWYRRTGILLWPASKRLLNTLHASLPRQVLRLHNMLPPGGAAPCSSLQKHLARLARHSGLDDGEAAAAGEEGRPSSPDSFVISLGSRDSPGRQDRPGRPGSPPDQPGSPGGWGFFDPFGSPGSMSASLAGSSDPSSASESDLGSDAEQAVRSRTADDWFEGGVRLRKRQEWQAARHGRERWGPEPAVSAQQLASAILAYMQESYPEEGGWWDDGRSSLSCMAVMMHLACRLGDSSAAAALLAITDRDGFFQQNKLRDEVTHLLACFGWPAEWRPLLRKWFKPIWGSDCKPAMRLLHSCLCAANAYPEQPSRQGLHEMVLFAAEAAETACMQGFAPGMKRGPPASTAAALLSLMRQVGGPAGEMALQRTVAALLSQRAWKDPATGPWGHCGIPETGLPDPAVTRVAVCCLATACAAAEHELGVAGMAGSPALLKLVASLLVEAAECLLPPAPQPAGGEGPAGALPHWKRAQLDRVAADRARALPSLEAAHQMLQHILIGCVLHLLAGHGSGGVQGSAGSAGGSQREEGSSQPGQAAALSPSAQPAKKGAH